MQRAEDEDILALAAAEGYVVITLDADFHSWRPSADFAVPPWCGCAAQVARPERLGGALHGVRNRGRGDQIESL